MSWRSSIKLKPKHTPYLILGIMLSATVIITLMTYYSAKEAEELILTQRISDFSATLEKHLTNYITLLQAGAGLYNSQRRLDAASWRSFTEELELRDIYPGIQGLGFSARLAPSEVPSLTARMRAQGIRDFLIYPANPPRPEYHAILYLEPQDARNKVAIGYDMFSEPVRRAAMERARDTHSPAMSGKVTLVQEIDQNKQAGFLIYYPVYNNVAPKTVSERRRTLVGYIYSPLRAGDFLNAVIKESNVEDMKIAIYDGLHPTEKSLLYVVNPEIGTGDSLYTYGRRITVAGQSWTIAFSVSPRSINTPQEKSIPFIIVGGILMSFTFFGLSMSQQRDREAMRVAIGNLERAHKREHFLATTSKILSASVDYEATLQNVAQAAVPAIADWCSIDIFEDGVLSQLALVHRDLDKIALAKDLRKKYPPNLNASTGLGPVITFSKTEFYSHITDQMIKDSAVDPEHYRILKEVGLTSAMIIPLKVRGKARGAITLVSAESGHHYTAEDLAIAESLAIRASLVIENARLFSESQKAVNIRDEFMAIASHELKTPLTSVRGYVQLLDRTLKGTSEEARLFVSKANLYIDRLNKLIEELLDVSRIQSGKLTLHLEKLDLDEVIKDSLESIRYVNTKHQIKITGDRKIKTIGDKARIEQVLINLLTNAIKYSPQTNIITIETKRLNHEALVIVKDYGIGIPADSLDQIFNRFYRVESATRSINGLGIGLYISRNIIDRHGGKMWVESVQGQGATFFFTLPLLKEDKEKAES